VGPRLSTLLALNAAALAAASAALLLAVALPLAGAGALRAPAVIALAAGEAVLVFVLGAAILARWVGRPVSRLLRAAERLEQEGGGLPVLGPPGEDGAPDLSRAAVAFERTVAALAAERARLAAKVVELEAANRGLAEARESLLRAERLATVGRLAAGVAHEIGNPLGAVSGYVELARARLAAGRAAPEEVADFLARASAEAQRIDLIVRDLLDFARPAAVERVPVAVGEAVAAAVRLASVQARFAAVEVVLALPGALPPVLAEGRRLVQVFLNLLLNAGDAMGGRGRVRVEASHAAEWVEVVLADEGPGIPAEHLDRVFEPFFTTKDAGRGTGLGLSVCHGIVEGFGGSITAANRAGGGAAFRLRLHAAGAAAGPPRAPC
jgi:C4-dicarboxylate-specific signal transduction histidine kinase